MERFNDIYFNKINKNNLLINNLKNKFNDLYNQFNNKKLDNKDNFIIQFLKIREEIIELQKENKLLKDSIILC